MSTTQRGTYRRLTQSRSRDCASGTLHGWIKNKPFCGRPTEDIRSLKRETDALLNEALPLLKVTREQIVGKLTPRFNNIRADVRNLGIDVLDLHGFGGEEGAHLAMPPLRISEFRWERTMPFSDFSEFTVAVEEGGSFAPRVHIFDHLNYRGDDIWVGSVGYFEDYVLRPGLFPSTTKTSFVVNTEVRTGGVISGFTGFYHWLWAADDKTCKCRKIIQPTAFLSTGQVLSSDLSSAQLIDLEDVSPVGQANVDITLGGGRYISTRTSGRLLQAERPSS